MSLTVSVNVTGWPTWDDHNCGRFCLLPSNNAMQQTTLAIMHLVLHSRAPRGRLLNLVLRRVLLLTGGCLNGLLQQYRGDLHRVRVRLLGELLELCQRRRRKADQALFFP